MNRIYPALASAFLSLVIITNSTYLFVEFAQAQGTPTNECQNWQAAHPEWIFCDDFEIGNLSRWDQTGTKNTVTSNAQNVLNGTYALQARLDTAAEGGENLMKWFMPGYEEIYVRFFVKFQAGYQNRRLDGYGMHLLGIAGNRIDDPWSSFGHSGTRPTGTDRFTTAIDPGQIYNDGTLRPLEFYTYFPEMSCAGGCWGNLFSQTSPQTPLVGGQWQQVEARVKANTPNLHDGLQELWINNILKVSVQNMRWRDTTDLKLNDIDFFFYMPNNIGTQYIYLDNVVVSRQPIGNIGGSIPSGDTTAPVVSLTSPANGASVSGSNVSLAANASDNVGVLGVQFKLDGNNIGTEDTVAPYALIWSTAGVSNGAHVLTATARDAAGNSSTSTAVTITVNNSGQFTIGSRVRVTGLLNVRATPGGTVLGNHDVGALATIIGGPTQQGGSTWWNLDYDQDPDGWSSDLYLELYQSDTSAPAQVTDLTVQ